MGINVLRLFIYVSAVLFVQINDIVVFAIQEYHFQIVQNYSLPTSSQFTKVASSSISECALNCLTFMGNQNCKTATFRSITGVCWISSVFFVEGDLHYEFDADTMIVISQGSSTVTDCGSPEIQFPNLLVTSAVPYSTLLGSSVSVSCRDPSYAPTHSTINCDASGVWVPPVQCNLDDCGTLNVNHAITKYTNSSTVLGSRAVVECNSNFVLTTNEASVDMECTGAGWRGPNGVQTPVCWELMFRGTQGNGFDLASIYLYGSGSSHVAGMTTSHPVCQNVFDTSCNLHYRNPHLDNWASLDVKQVRYEFYNGTDTVMSLTVNATGSTMTDWFEFGKTNSLYMPWSDINLSNTWWALVDWDLAIGRSFRVVENYGYCTGDLLYTFIMFEPLRPPGSSAEDIMCNYELEHTTWPQFMYTLNGVKSNFDTDEYGLATTMAIWVLHGQ